MVGAAASPYVEVEYCAITQVGLRDDNQDALMLAGWVGQARDTGTAGRVTVQHAPFTCAVLDGMGGYTGGALAARTAAHALVRGFDDDGADLSPEAVSARLAEASEAVRLLAGSVAGHDQMGATAALVVVSPAGVTIANVGDCRVYRLWEGFFSQVSVDHRIPDYRSPGASLVTQALGAAHPGPTEPHQLSFPVGGETTLLLCSDGLHDVIPDNAVAAILESTPDLGAAAQRLVQAVLEAGATDNVSVIVLRARDVGVEDHPDSPERRPGPQ